MLTEMQIAKLVRALAKAKGWSETYAAQKTTGSGDTLARWDGGVNLTLSRAAKIMKNIESYWPSDLAWPEDIPRPDRTTMSKGSPSFNKNKSHERTRA